MLFAHWVGDYALQTNQMASLKAFSLKWLSIHVLVYIIPITITAFVVFPTDVAWKFVAVNAMLHWLTDLVTGRLAHKHRDNPRMYYPIIGFDQFVHAACLLGTPLFI